MIHREVRHHVSRGIISVAAVADRETSRGALLALIEDDEGLIVAGSAASAMEARPLLDLERLDVILVNLPLSARPMAEGIDFIRFANICKL